MYNENKEIAEFESEKEQLELKTYNYQNSIAEHLTDELGADIRKTLANPIKITRFKLFKIRITYFFKSLLEIL